MWKQVNTMQQKLVLVIPKIEFEVLPAIASVLSPQGAYFAVD
jgi:hypothetical protein